LTTTHKGTTQLNKNLRQPADRRQRAQRENRTNNAQNVRIHWQRRHEHFTSLARTASVSGNAVDAENYFQHAEHYFRMMQGTAA
jgi:hypothetical protein